MGVLQIKNASGLIEYLNVIGTGTNLDPYEIVRPPYEVSYAVQQILDTYGDTVSVREKLKSLIKFGKNPDIDANIREMVWNVGDIEVLPTGNTINRIVSNNVADNQIIKIEGHTIDGSGNLTFVVQSATLNGTTPVVLTTPLARCTRAYNDDSTVLLGSVNIYVDGGATHCNIATGTQQSLKGATSISQVDYYIISDWEFSVNKSATAVVDFELQVRLKGKVFRTVYTASTSSTAEIHFRQPIIVPPNSDVRVLATSGTNNTSVTTAIHGWLAIKQ